METLMLVLAPLATVALVVASWLAGGWRNAVLDGAEDARARLAEDYPELEAARVLVARDGRAALLAGAAGDQVAAIIGLGDRLVTRRLDPGAIRAVRLQPGPGASRTLRILTRDPTCRRIDLHLDAAADAAQARGDDVAPWMDILHRLAQDPQAPRPATSTPQRAEA